MAREVQRNGKSYTMDVSAIGKGNQTTTSARATVRKGVCQALAENELRGQPCSGC